MVYDLVAKERENSDTTLELFEHVKYFMCVHATHNVSSVSSESAHDIFDAAIVLVYYQFYILLIMI